MWEILDTGMSSAERNMAIDAELLAAAKVPTMHFYEWERDSATFGHFIKPEGLLNVERAGELGLDLAKRPTGGGVVFHMWDMAFSVVVPACSPLFSKNTLDNYALINNLVLKAARSFLGEGMGLIPEDIPSIDGCCQNFCMAKPTKYDLVMDGKKIAGASQRQTKGGFLHQGTIALIMPEIDYLEAVLKEGTRVKEAMQTFTYPLLGKTASRKELLDAKLTLKQLLMEYATTKA